MGLAHHPPLISEGLWDMNYRQIVDSAQGPPLYKALERAELEWVVCGRTKLEE